MRERCTYTVREAGDKRITERTIRLLGLGYWLLNDAA
jgi:hypothetical protein